MTDTTWTPNEEVRLAEYLAGQVCGRASGRLQTECWANAPRDTYFIGSLRPADDNVAEVSGRISPELLSKLAPSALGMELRLRPDEASFTVSVDISWACYYRIWPTHTQQLTHQRGVQQPISGAAAEEDAEEDSNSQDESGEARLVEDEQDADAISPEPSNVAGPTGRRHRRSDTLAIRFRKIECGARGDVTVASHDASPWIVDCGNLQAAIDAEISRAEQLAGSDNERLRTGGPPAEASRVPEGVLTSEASFSAFLRGMSHEVVPHWAIETLARVSNAEAALDLALEWVNRSHRVLTARGSDSPNVETYLFDVRASLSIAGAECLPYELVLAPRGFRYDRELWGRGFNAAVVRDDRGSFRTDAAPVFMQRRHATRNVPEPTFSDLAADPLPVLRSVLAAAEEYAIRWDAHLEEHSRRPDWNTDFEAEFERDRRQFTDEIRRFRRGIDLVESNADVALAFRLTNEAFARGRNRAWRIFQLVFLVAQIPGIASLTSEDAADREFVDIVFFPTGGGKTEAYLATITFNCFYDRLRGKTTGVSGWIRFPLRLLTLQQTQRVADLIGAAELVRAESSDPRLRDGAPFGIGYFVGQDGSPNQLADPRLVRFGERFAPEWSQAHDDNVRQKWKRIARCPACHTATIHVDFDDAARRLIHHCTNSSCPFPGGVLPVFIVDNEIYRYLPSVLVGTIDKLAGVGNQRKFSMLLGRVAGQCASHGYYLGRCSQDDCRDPALLGTNRPLGLRGPSLFVQDELHLLREGLGTFDGHYETFVQKLVERFGDPPIKIIASSATIEAFRRQVEHLFGRSGDLARTFPGPGPTLRESFYAETLDHPQRLFVGILPHNKTIFNAVLELLELYHRVVADLVNLPLADANPYGGELQPGTSGWSELLDNYATSLTYFLNKRELDSVHTDIEGDVNPNLASDGLAELDVLEMTGGVSTDEVQRNLEHLETARTESRHFDSVLSTSMISHGVDIDRLNMMLFDGMPRQTSEYIQASSRVGRSHCGVVFVGLHPARERDQSHYQYFLKYHEFLGQLVEPVAINRWATFARQRTMPGLFMAVLLQVLATASPGNPNRFYMADAIKSDIATGAITVDDFVPLLEAAYFGATSAETKAEVTAQVRRYFDQILSAPGSINFVSEALVPPPMSSLREVDEQLDILFDPATSAWIATTARTGTGGNG